jgi:hypothetical protein
MRPTHNRGIESSNLSRPTKSMNDFIDYDYVIPNDVFRTHKKIFNPEKQAFEDHTFCGVKKRNHTNAVKWLSKTYGVSTYGSGVWWETMEFVVMQERVYLHYLLARP